MRRRPGMYIGGTDMRAMHHLFAEVIDNSMDEAVAGHASFIEVEIKSGNTISVRDNGRGIPVDPHPKFKDKSALEVIMTTLHAGGKFGGEAYDTSGGLHGVGVSVVNALSSLLVVEVARDKKLHEQQFERGIAKGGLKILGACQKPARHLRDLYTRCRDFRGQDNARPRPALCHVKSQGLFVWRRRNSLALRA